KLVYKDQKVTKVDLAKLTNSELMRLVPSRNEFMSRHARRILQERLETAEPAWSAEKAALVADFRQMLLQADSTQTRLKVLWAEHCSASFAAGQDFGLGFLDSKFARDEFLRAWAIQLVGEELQSVPKGRDWERRT